MIKAISNQVSERIDDALDQALIKLGALTKRLQFNFLAQLGGGVAHHTGKSAEGEGHRHHAYRHDRFLNVARVALQGGYAV